MARFAQGELQSTKRQVTANRVLVEQLYEARDSAQNAMSDIKLELDQARAEMQVIRLVDARSVPLSMPILLF